MLPERPIRILIIDDDRADREIYRRCLGISAPWNFELAEADSAAEGVAQCRSWQPDCVLLDYNLPDQDGLEMLAALRGPSERVPCAVVMLTAFGGEELAVRAMKAGVTDYLSKGRVGADTLPHTIVNAVEKWRMLSRIAEQQSELQRSARQQEVLLEAIPQMVWMARADGIVEYANRRWFEYTGLGLDRAQLFGWDHLLHPDDRERTLTAWSRAGGSASIFEIEHRLRRVSDETYRWHLVRAAPLRNPAGVIVRWFGTCTDIEDQKRLENELLQRQKLESIGRLAGGLAHDFNNLLVAILGGASLAMESLPPTHPAQKLLEGVVDAGDRAAQLTRQMLSYAGKSNLFIEPVDIRELIRDTCALIRSSLPPGLRLDAHTETGVPPIDTDKEQMRQVVMDLLMNAVEAVGQTGGNVTIRADSTDVGEKPETEDGSRSALAPGKYVVLEVQDTGCGIDDELRKKIFDPFFTTKSTGRGLGLAAVQGFVRSNRGDIQIDSAPGRGTRFRILLPAAMEVVGRTCGAA